MTADIQNGKSYPLGATVSEGGVNFSLFTKNCQSVELLLFNDVNDTEPSEIIKLDPEKNLTFYYWHVFIKGLKSGQLYGYRVYGDFKPNEGLYFDGWKVLIDPYARGVIAGKNYRREAAINKGDNCAYAMKSVVVDSKLYDWEEDEVLRYPYNRSIIYELHVGGFTRHPNSGLPEGKRGTFAGLIEKIPYLKSLGITAVELLPIQEFDEEDAPKGLSNYWGYSPIAFFAPHVGYSSRKDPLGPVDEFRDMVKALHKAGIEVILDVVFNHTAEGNEKGPTYSFKGLEAAAYYILNEQYAYAFSNYSGCGNTFKTNHSIVRRYIMDCLRYWVSEMHVDGFRFDLASVLSRDESGEPLKNPPILWSIESDPILAGTKIIAEAWDAAGLYQVGSFVGHRWAEWNGPFRDDVRQFLKSDFMSINKFMPRLTGSHDLYHKHDREPNRSINFITSHDGLTLNDLVSFNMKHNLCNLEQNRDGCNHNFSWNCGHEGPTDDLQIEALRLKQIKNFFTVLMIAQGTPMMTMGDEVRRTQEGNNNAYCQNNHLSWFDWENLNTHKELLAFVKNLIQFNFSNEVFQQTEFWTNSHKNSSVTKFTWHGVKLGQPDVSPVSHSIAYSLNHKESQTHFHVMINAYWEPLTFELPPLPFPEGFRWHQRINTAKKHPEDFNGLDNAPAIDGDFFKLDARSIVLLQAINPMGF